MMSRRALGIVFLVGWIPGAWLAGAPAYAGPLADAVLVPHISPSLEYSFGHTYEARSDLRRCEDALVEGQVYTPETVVGQICYIMASFEDSPGPVTLYGIDFGFESYDASAISFVDFGVSAPQTLMLSTDGWPGPNEGLAVVYTLGPARDRVVEVCWMAAYVYAPVSVPLGVDPATSNAEVTSNNQGPIEADPIEPYNMGIMAFGQDGYNPCAPVEMNGACCLQGRCHEITRLDCELQGGLFLGVGHPCFPNPCEGNQERVTTWGRLKRIYEHN